MNDENASTPEEATEIVRPTTNNKVEVSADLLNEAVTQLRKLTEIRQRESERQERAIAQMQKSLKRQGILSRYVILTSLIVVILCGGIAYFMRKSVQNESFTVQKLSQVDEQLAAASQTIAEETQRQVASLDNVRTEVVTAREEQTRLSRGLEQELQATRQTQAAVIQKVEEQLGSVRQERDEVRGEVRTMLEEKTRQFTEREIQLRSEREAIKEAKIRSREEQKELIQQTIERLNAMTASLTVNDEAAPTDADIQDIVTQVDEVEATIQESAAEETASEPVVAPVEVEAAPAAEPTPE